MGVSGPQSGENLTTIESQTAVIQVAEKSGSRKRLGTICAILLYDTNNESLRPGYKILSFFPMHCLLAAGRIVIKK